MKFNIINKEEIPDSARKTSEKYKELIDSFEEMGIDQAMLVEFDTPRETDRLRATLYYYFGKGSHSMKALDKTKKKFVLIKL